MEDRVLLRLRPESLAADVRSNAGLDGRAEGGKEHDTGHEDHEDRSHADEPAPPGSRRRRWAGKQRGLGHDHLVDGRPVWPIRVHPDTRPISSSRSTTWTVDGALPSEGRASSTPVAPGPFAPDDPSGGHGNARRNQPGAVSTPRWTSLDVIAAGLPRIGGRPEPCGEARSRPDRRRCGDRSSPRLTVPTAPSGKTYLTGAPAGPQRPYPRDSQCSCNIHPRIRKVCGRNVDDLAGQASRESSDPAVSRVVRLIERSGL